MAMHITQNHAKQALTKYEALKKRIAGLKEKSEHTVQQVVRTAEVGGAAFAMGLVQGRTGGVEIFGVPLELGLGLGLNVFGLLGGAGEHSDHLLNVGNGCLASYATTLGRGIGTTMAAKAGGTPAAQVTDGGAAKTSGTRLTDREIAEMAGLPT
jgi:hypothetical protein